MVHDPDPAHGIREAPPDSPIRLPAEGTDAAQSVPMTPEEPPAWLDTVDMILAGLVVVLSFLLGSFAATNSDVWMQLASGRLLSEGGFEFGVDPFSVATEATKDRPAQYWVHHSWLFSWLLYQLYTTFGGPTLVVLKALAFVLLVVLMFRVRFAGTNRWLQMICVLLAALAISHRLLLQPTVVSFLFMGVTLYLLHRAGVFRAADTEGEASPRALWLLPPLFCLWANLDNWFVLGPFVVGMCAVAAGVLRLVKLPRPVPGTTLTLVFLVGLAACLVNPFHVHVFQLPPELAYVVLRLTDPLGVPLPEFLVAGGRALQNLQFGEPQSTMWLSPLSPRYFQNQGLGLNVAGMAFYPLLLLGLIAFVLQAMSSGRPGAPILQACRFAPWLGLAVLAVMNYRIIPFFAAVAGPLTAMTLSESMGWQRSLRAQSIAVRRWGAAKAIRIVSVVFVLLLFFLAWPGWLHGPADFAAQHRVAWDVPIDPSYRAAAERLAARKPPGPGGNVFNFSADLGNYGAWFAPGVKHFIDYRYNLYPEATETFIKVRQALTDRTKKAQTWQKVFLEHGIDYVALTNFATSPGVGTWLLEPQTWALQYGDNKAMVFAWAGKDRRWEGDLLQERWRALAFGDVPPEYRAPREGPVPPLEPPGFWTLYWHGPQPTPPAVQEVYLKVMYYQLAAQRWLPMAEATSIVGDYLAAAVMTAGVPGTVDPAVPWLATWGTVRALLSPARNPNAQPFMRGQDQGPPAVPVLMVRLARQAVAENPQEHRAYLALADAYKTLWKSQEDYWVTYAGYNPSNLRTRVRQMQTLTATYNAAVLKPTDPDLHITLAEAFLQQHYLDLALTHLRQAEQALMQQRPTGKEQIDAQLKNQALLKQRTDMIAAEVERRQRDFERASAGMKGMQKFYVLTQAAYRTLDKENRERFDQRGYGLPGLALKLLNEMPDSELEPRDQLERLRGMLYLMLTTGRAAEVADVLPGWHDKLGPYYHELNVYLAGTLGNYPELQKSLDELARSALRGEMEAARMIAVSTVAYPVQGLGPVLMGLGLAGNVLQTSLAQELDMRTFQAIAALEVGDTRQARDLLDDVVRRADGQVEFVDLPVARRYRELLHAAAK